MENNQSTMFHFHVQDFYTDEIWKIKTLKAKVLDQIEVNLVSQIK